MKYPAHDKLLHYIIGLWIYMAFSLWFGYASIWFVVVAGILKEVHDGYHPDHTSDFNDFMYTLYGGLTILAWETVKNGLTT